MFIFVTHLLYMGYSTVYLARVPMKIWNNQPLKFSRIDASLAWHYF